MLKDLNNINNQIYDIGIIGAGPAGITLALNLSKKFSVALLEGGDFDFSENSQNIYKGNNSGDKYFDLDETRLRLFGGSSNHWGGMCRPLENFDFKKKIFSKLSHWPLDKMDLDAYLQKACNILEIKNNFIKKKIYKEIQEINFQFSPPVNFNSKYKKSILYSNNIHLFLNSNALYLTPGNSLTDVLVANYKNKKFSLKAKRIILCLGGIETSRFLLLSKSKNRSFLKNNDNVGKFWMEHPHYVIGDVIFKEKNDYSKTPIKYEDLKYYVISDRLKLEKKILNCSLRLDRYKKNPYQKEQLKKLIYDLSCVAPELSKKIFDLFDKNLVCGGRLISVSEQEPNVESFISLNNKEKDRFGLPRANLNWKKNIQDIKTIRTTAEIFANYFASEDHGRIAIQSWLYDDKFTENDNFIAGNHHMGGCRISSSSKNGVVNHNFELHDHKNVFICGSSIFPSGGHSNPTLTIIQLALSLAKKFNNNIL